MNTQGSSEDPVETGLTIATKQGIHFYVLETKDLSGRILEKKCSSSDLIRDKSPIGRQDERSHQFINSFDLACI